MKEGIGFFVGLIGIIIDIVWAFNTGKIALLVIGSIFIGIGYHLLGLDKIFGKKKDKIVLPKTNQQNGSDTELEKIAQENKEHEYMSIHLTEDEKRQEDEKFHEIAEWVVHDLTQSGFFKSEKIQFLAEKVNSNTAPGYGYSDPFSYEDCLSVEEKRLSV
jgi:hypothetical protein